MKQQLAMALTNDHLGSYRLIRLLGQGGSARVYMGKHIYLNTKAALKVLHVHLTCDEIKGFQIEARLLASMRHRHIVRVLDFGVEEHAPYLVMEYAPNGTLRQQFPAGIPMPLNFILPYVMQIADALQYVHHLNLIHCDIKPENVLLGPANEVWLSDFGIARVDQYADREKAQQVRGTAAYMAPEQILGNPLPASDQYALAVLLYTSLSGGLPFSGPPLQVCSQHLKCLPPRLRKRVPSIAPPVEYVVMKALAKDPSQRFATMKDFAQALQGASQEKQPLVLSQGNGNPRRASVQKIVPPLAPIRRAIGMGRVETPPYVYHGML